MKQIKKVIFMCLIYFLSISFANAQGQNIGVYVDNSSVQVPDKPEIIKIDNITTQSLDLTVQVGPDFSNETLIYTLEITNSATGETRFVEYTQESDNNSQSVLNVTGLDPGTEYVFKVKYRRDGGVTSDYSDPKTATTKINPPTLTSIKDITQNSLVLEAEVDPAFVGSTMDFIIEVKNDDTGDTYTISLTKLVTNQNELFEITDLIPDTNYTFKIKYARENTSNYSDYSNEKSAHTNSEEEDDEDDELQKPEIIDIKNQTQDSLDLVVEIDDKYYGDDIDFTVRIINQTTGAVTVVHLDNIRTDENGIAILNIDGLDPNTTYEFKVKYLPEGEDNPSEYSDPALASTLSSQNTTVIQDTEKDTKQDKPKDKQDKPKDKDKKDTKQDKQDKPKPEETIKTQNKQDTYKTAAVIGTVAGLANSVIPLFSAMPGMFGNTMFLRFLELFGIVGRRKNKQNWGVVFDHETHVPIPAAKIVLSNKQGKEMATTYSDREGRYGFLVDNGEYIISVFKKDYEIIPGLKEDELYGNLYDGNSITVEDQNVMTVNIPMKSKKQIDWEQVAQDISVKYNVKWELFKKYFFSTIYFAGFAFTLVVTYLYPSLFNYIVSSIYIILFIIQLFVKQKKYGVVKTSKGKPIPFAVVSVYDKVTNMKKSFAVTDSIGRYFMLVDDGVYTMKVKGQPISGMQFEKTGTVHVRNGVLRKDIIV